MEQTRAGKKEFQGTITSAKMRETALVLTRRLVMDPKYKKRYWVSKKYKAHNPEDRYKEGDEVVIRESRPLSKEKRWVIIEKSTKSQAPNSK